MSTLRKIDSGVEYFAIVYVNAYLSTYVPSILSIWRPHLFILEVLMRGEG